MTQLADAVERAPRADGVLGTRESERGVQRLADGGVRLGGNALCADPRGQLVFILGTLAFGADGDDALASGRTSPTMLCQSLSASTPMRKMSFFSP